MQSGGAPVLVLNQNTKRETGRKAQLGNVAAAKVRMLRSSVHFAPILQTQYGHTERYLTMQAVSDIVRTTLGPRSMLKMLLDPMGGIVMTNDGNAILREIDVAHPAAKSMIELSRNQDEEVGDGTTSVIILGEYYCPCYILKAPGWQWAASHAFWVCIRESGVSFPLCRACTFLFFCSWRDVGGR
jgi:hypothetical protein